MDRILVPWDGDGGFLPHAVHFAVEFAKRTDARLLFLSTEQNATAGDAALGPDGACADGASDLERAVTRARTQGLDVECYTTTGDYVRQVAAFVREHHVSRVVIALPEVGSAKAVSADARVSALREHLGCVLVTVRPRRGRVPSVSIGEREQTSSPLASDER